MTGSTLPEKMLPALLEDSAREVGELIGESLAVQEEAAVQGRPAELFSPLKKTAVTAGFKSRESGTEPVFLLIDFEAAVELAGRLIMLPADEIAASRKRGKLEGELLDAFSEIANIISGTLNTTCHEALPHKKLHFVKDEIAVLPSGEAALPLAEQSCTCFSGQLVRNDERLGVFRFLFPDRLLRELETKTAGAAPAGQPAAEAKSAEAPAATQTGDDGTENRNVPAAADAPDSTGADAAAVDSLLIEGLEPAAEELQALLGQAVSFTGRQTGYREKADLLARTRGKQVLTRIRATGEKQGQGFMLLPLKDAVYFGGLLLMMPAESITETVKQGGFEGEIADAFGEIANILVGCFSNRFQNGAPFRLKLQKDSVETLVPAQVDPASAEPFPADQYYRVSTGIQMGDRTYGPLEILFPPDLLGLAPRAAFAADAGQSRPEQSPGRQKPVPGQKNDTGERPARNRKPPRVISVIGEDPVAFEALKKSIDGEDIEIARVSPDGDLKEVLAENEPNCVFLFINRVNDQGLAKAIKVRAALKKDCPLIVAGPGWTKSTVLKARKYGATDILVTPADREVIRRKYRKYMQ